LFASLGDGSNQNAFFRIMDIKGRLILENKNNVVDGVILKQIDLPESILSGTYFVSVTLGD
jgi:hypothetical protein